MRPHSAAARAGLRAGDIVVALDGARAPQPAAIERAYRSLPAQGGILLTIRRGLSHEVVALEKP